MSWGLGCYDGRRVERAPVQTMRSAHCCHFLSTFYTRIFYTHVCGFLKFISTATGMATFSANLWSPGWEPSSGFFLCDLTIREDVTLIFPPHGFPWKFCERMLFLELSMQVVHTTWRKKRGEKVLMLSVICFSLPLQWTGFAAALFPTRLWLRVASGECRGPGRQRSTHRGEILKSRGFFLPCRVLVGSMSSKLADQRGGVPGK